MLTFADRVAEFNKNLDFGGNLPEGINIMNPFRENPQIALVSEQFYGKFHSDTNKRRLILGINPGRFGAGVTGVPFTDTKRMEEYCGIKIEGLKTHEPSSVFIYKVIEAYGGVKKFYSDFFIGAVCPLGFTKENNKGKFVNYNYYDSKQLSKAVYDFIVDNIKKLINFGVYTDVCYCLGTGKNADYLTKLNSEHKLFSKIISLEHPRFIMQYRAKKMKYFVQKYIKTLRKRA